MAWTAPRTWTTGELVTAAMMNTYVSDNDTYLKGETDKVHFNSGTYVGDSTDNKAIAHGLSTTPKIVLIVDVDIAIEGFFFRIFGAVGKIFFQGAYSPWSGWGVVTIPNATNFYVGNTSPGYTRTANFTGRTHYWVAIG